jgi:hypothetical protein
LTVGNLAVGIVPWHRLITAIFMVRQKNDDFFAIAAKERQKSDLPQTFVGLTPDPNGGSAPWGK